MRCWPSASNQTTRYIDQVTCPHLSKWQVTCSPLLAMEHAGHGPVTKPCGTLVRSLAQMANDLLCVAGLRPVTKPHGSLSRSLVQMASDLLCAAGRRPASNTRGASIKSFVQMANDLLCVAGLRLVTKPGDSLIRSLAQMEVTCSVLLAASAAR